MLFFLKKLLESTCISRCLHLSYSQVLISIWTKESHFWAHLLKELHFVQISSFMWGRATALKRQWLRAAVTTSTMVRNLLIPYYRPHFYQHSVLSCVTRACDTPCSKCNRQIWHKLPFWAPNRPVQSFEKSSFFTCQFQKKQVVFW